MPEIVFGLFPGTGTMPPLHCICEMLGGVLGSGRGRFRSPGLLRARRCRCGECRYQLRIGAAIRRNGPHGVAQPSPSSLGTA